MRLNLSADEVLATTRSVRKRLDFERPVEREVLLECLELALQAPTGSNRQGWQWVFVDDPDTKLQLRDIYRERWAGYAQMPRPNYAEGDVRGERMDAVSDSAAYLAEHMHLAPYLLVPCIEGRVEQVAGELGAGTWGSLLPAVWSFMLALRERGLGSAWTTLHLIGGGEQQAAELLGIPYEKYRQAGLFPIAYTQGTDFKPASRLPAEDVSRWNTW
ncbi:MAG TPA: nitroreductase family protein [Ilumatobacter sp.]|nr:nitroreductase family protein [Ilumatobacter sp.]